MNTVVETLRTSPGYLQAVLRHPQGSALTAPLEAQAKDRPCQLYRYHRPKPSRTQGHHRHPVYLQNRVFGHILLPELLWVCGTCHDAVHDWISYLLGRLAGRSRNRVGWRSVRRVGRSTGT